MQSPIKRKKRNETAVMDIDGIRKAMLENVAASPARLTPQHLEKTILETYGLDKIRAKSVLKDLVAHGQLEYTYEFGSTYLVLSFSKPVRISAHVVVRPPGHRYRPAPDEVVIQIKPGAAFGGGRHPTTRLSVKAIEFLLKKVRPDWLNANGSVLDIGTGSGILAIAAVCLGVNKGLAIDIDPCAIAEAAENIAINHLEGQLVVSGRQLDTIHRSFSMVVANLRYPSLKKLYPQITEQTDPNGGVVLSGFRLHERNDLIDLYTAKHFECIWTADELEWVAVVLKKI
ncbi:MAG: 50S ribosomal protein L11 methyltransferase [Desulfobacterales bacterium]|jgi:ribosomal protein L11 methyltransferase|nr:50S ribosomal protein L11 methyltransferase [Desulfobacterales bacterium]